MFQAHSLLVERDWTFPRDALVMHAGKKYEKNGKNRIDRDR